MSQTTTQPDPYLKGLQAYIVGGAVRDGLLGLPHGDRDWVVVASTPEDMVHRGFIPVGGDFPVFLHPITKEEFALARTERKSGRGYKGFTFYTGADVTLEDDLKRRDLTVNAIAQSISGELIDPLHGAQDVRDKILRHVGPAFEEDPVRILRLARFAARFTDFRIAPETLELCRKMVRLGEVDHLVPERVWQEIARGLMSEQPSRMLNILADTGAAARVLVDWVDSKRVRTAVDSASELGLALSSRYALLCVETIDLASLSKQLRAPADCGDMARLLQLVLSKLDAIETAQDEVHPEKNENVERVLSLMESCDALRKPDRFIGLIHTVNVLRPLQVRDWQRWLSAILSLDAGAAAKLAPTPQTIRETVREARRQALLADF
ncbi:CCA tRNA nucleotidyltransferase [Orrella sp. NBD-18]|uniref:CCA tRNA nucleotidyltransferase n=1 Tax=Sheuella amnicola TaxID=2707330 RepID=A0A6B2R187_9BURK|nr:CCA tRNA nucleotidyltransferase [Sheuella amnicola]NDY83394.1 CCA tRNA nucleotidyltransferase [Sheuella amnicola]